MANPAIYYHSKHRPYDWFVQIILPPGRQHGFSSGVVDEHGRDQKGRSLFRLLHKEPLSAAPNQMWIDPALAAGTIVREIEA